MSLMNVSEIIFRVTAPGKGQESAHVTVGMKATCVTSVLTCTLRSKMKILNLNVQVSLICKFC